MFRYDKQNVPRVLRHTRVTPPMSRLLCPRGARIPGKTWATQIASGKKESEAGKLVILWLREECPNRHEPAKKKQAISPQPPFLAFKHTQATTHYLQEHFNSSSTSIKVFWCNFSLTVSSSLKYRDRKNTHPGLQRPKMYCASVKKAAE